MYSFPLVQLAPVFGFAIAFSYLELQVYAMYSIAVAATGPPMATQEYIA